VPVTADDATTVFAHHGGKLLYRVREAAGMLGLGESKVWELLARGVIESVKIDGARRIPREAIESYVRGLREGGGDAEAG
jgi:excisionase family DNA binding protein